MRALKTYEYQIGELHGEIQKDTVRAALASVFLDYLESSHGISESMTCFRLMVKDKNYQLPKRAERPKTFVVHNHENKANAFIRALWECGWHRSNLTHVGRKVDLFLTDHATTASRIGTMDDFALMGTERFLVYPHTARPNLVNDIMPESKRVTAHLVSAPGHVDVMRAYGYEKPLHVVGWSLCPIRPFSPKPEPRKVLFAPIHERCAEVDKKANREAFQRLYQLVQSGDIHLTVRYYHAQGGSGLPGSGLELVRHPEIEYHCITQLEPDWEQIDQADLVVAHQTFAWLAVARGIPAVMVAEDMPAHLVPKNQDEKFSKNWRKYQHLLAFPYDLLTCATPDETLSLLRRAVACDAEISGWKRRMIGEPFDEKAFLNVVEGY